MSEFKLISPMLDNFAMGDSISEHNGVYSCPAMENDSDNKYIVKIVSTPTSQSQLDALLLSGAYPDNEAADAYFRAITDDIAEEAQILEKLSQLEGFLGFKSWQIVSKEETVGYDLYLLSQYRQTLLRQFKRSNMTHLGALNLGLDLCAALAVCRRLGYLYVNLKPENVYLTGENEYRIGDLGFIKLDSLKFASLPDRYRSNYTAPEITDAFSSLNTTMDVYALGLILYQAFNDGALPVIPADTEEAQIPAPAYADYEMSEIILKACAQNPDERWQDPIQMGQALISYMQRNGAHDIPIIPEVVNDGEEAVESNDVGAFEQISDESEEITESDIAEEMDSAEDVPVTEDEIFSEDEDGNLTLISDDTEDETAPLEEDVSEDYEQISDDVSEILNQADELISHQAPEPVVAPEPVEVTLPEAAEENTDSEESENSDSTDEETSVEEIADDVQSQDEESASEYIDAEQEEDSLDDDFTECNDESEEETEQDETDKISSDRNTAGIWIRNTLLVLLALVVIATGILFYSKYYLQPIDAIYLDEITSGTLTVSVNSQIDENKLTVLCVDMYGNSLSAPVVNGKAVFTGLAPDSAYSLRINIDGFHRLTGDTEASFTTPEETNIVQFQAVTGAENGSVILGFTVEGPDANEWSIRYSAENEEEKITTFTGHVVTISGLTVGSEYTFKLLPDSNLLLAGTDEIKHTASNVIKAEHLTITGCIDGKLTAKWSAPENSNVENWTVRCYNDKGYDKTQVVTDTTVTFEEIDASVDHTLEVTAASMSVSERAFAPANAITVTQFSVDSADTNQIKLSWVATTEKDWKLIYTVNGTASQEVNCGKETTVTVREIIPGAEYKFTLQASDGTAVLGGEQIYQTKEAETFSAYGITADEMQFKMCKTPAHKNWDRYDLKSSDYTTEFKVGKKASFLVKLSHKPDRSTESVVTLYVIRNSEGSIISSGSNTMKWNSMWDNRYGEFDIPSLPGSVGEYSVSVYLNGALAHTQNFTVVS